MERNRIRTIADWMVILPFLGAIGLPLVGALFDASFNKAESDGRELAALPMLFPKGSSLKAFPGAFEQYWNDHFGFRGLLIRGLTVAKVRWLHVSSSVHVMLGRESWLFFTNLPAGADHATIHPFTEGELDVWQRVLERRRDWLAQRGCRYLLLIAPDKQTIYPEYVGPQYLSKLPRSRLDQLLERLRARSRIDVVDVRPLMWAAKEHDRLYHKTDSHWNGRGAFIAYQEVAAALSQWFPAVQPLPRSAFIATREPGIGDLANMVSLKELGLEDVLTLTPLRSRRAHAAKEGVVPPPNATLACQPFATECDDPQLPRAVMFHDSFLNCLDPFLSEHFRRIAYVFHYDLHQDVVERERPEVVIQEMVERKLGCLIPK